MLIRVRSPADVLLFRQSCVGLPCFRVLRSRTCSCPSSHVQVQPGLVAVIREVVIPSPLLGLPVTFSDRLLSKHLVHTSWFSQNRLAAHMPSFSHPRQQLALCGSLQCHPYVLRRAVGQHPFLVHCCVLLFLRLVTDGPDGLFLVHLSRIHCPRDGNCTSILSCPISSLRCSSSCATLPGSAPRLLRDRRSFHEIDCCDLCQLMAPIMESMLCAHLSRTVIHFRRRLASGRDFHLQ